jgi:hypothetical protein
MRGRHGLGIAMTVALAAGCLTRVPLGGENPVDAASSEDVVSPSDAHEQEAANDGGACHGGSFGNGSGLCTADWTFFQSALAACGQSSTILSSFAADEKCDAGQSNGAEYTCCPGAPLGCTTGGLENGNGLCSIDNSLFFSAEQDCVATHTAVTAFELNDGGCEAGSATGGGYTCCP